MVANKYRMFENRFVDLIYIHFTPVKWLYLIMQSFVLFPLKGMLI